MEILKIAGATRILAEDQDEYQNLPILDTVICGSKAMVSAWKPTSEELSMLNDGGFILLSILGTVHPPVLLQVDNTYVDETESGDKTHEI